MQKLSEKVIALFKLFCLSELFANNYNTLKDICMQFCCSDNPETHFLTEKLGFAGKFFFKIGQLIFLNYFFLSKLIIYFKINPDNN